MQEKARIGLRQTLDLSYYKIPEYSMHRYLDSKLILKQKCLPVNVLSPIAQLTENERFSVALSLRDISVE